MLNTQQLDASIASASNNVLASVESAQDLLVALISDKVDFVFNQRPSAISLKCLSSKNSNNLRRDLEPDLHAINEFL